MYMYTYTLAGHLHNCDDHFALCICAGWRNNEGENIASNNNRTAVLVLALYYFPQDHKIIPSILYKCHIVWLGV